MRREVCVREVGSRSTAASRESARSWRGRSGDTRAGAHPRSPAPFESPNHPVESIRTSTTSTSQPPWREGAGPKLVARNEKPLDDDYEGPHACLLSVSLIVPVSGLALAPCCVRRLPGGQRARTLAPLLINNRIASMSAIRSCPNEIRVSALTSEQSARARPPASRHPRNPRPSRSTSVPGSMCLRSAARISSPVRASIFSSRSASQASVRFKYRCCASIAARQQS